MMPTPTIVCTAQGVCAYICAQRMCVYVCAQLVCEQMVFVCLCTDKCVNNRLWQDVQCIKVQGVMHCSLAWHNILIPQRM